jgi:hypothetical protein
MPREYDRFADVPIGPGLAADHDGLIVAGMSAGLSLSRTARGRIAHAAGTHGAEFVFWGDDPLVAAIGLLQGSAALGAALGAGAGSIGWRLATGQVYLAGAVVASGLTVPTKGQVVGVRFREAAGPAFFADFYLGAVLLHSASLPVGAAWYFGVSLATTNALGLLCAVNAGQWPVLSNAGHAGWSPPQDAIATIYLSDLDWMTAPTDAPANVAYDGMIEEGGIEILSELMFWPWGEPAARQANVAQFRVRDDKGVLDAFATDGTPSVAVSVRSVALPGTLAASTPVARFELDAVEIMDDLVRTVRLRDAHPVLDETVNRGVFLPMVPALAWQSQPLVIGAVASVPLLPANSDATVGFLSDAPLLHVGTVLDRGDALEAGTWSLTADGQQLLLESPPLGPVVADVSSIGAAMAPATLQQMLHALFSRVGFGSWLSADAAAIDVATGYAGTGLYIGGGALSVRQALAAVLPSYSAWYWQDGDGLIRISRIVDPDAVAEAGEFDHIDLGEDMLVALDNAPMLSRRATYRPNAAPMQAGDFVTDIVDVPASRRKELMQEARGTVYSALPLSPRYAAADRRPAMPMLFWREQDAQAEIDRVCAMYGIERRFYRWKIPGDRTLSATPGAVYRVRYDRYGMSAGRKLLLTSIRHNPITGDASLIFWG